MSANPLGGGAAPAWACAWGDDRYGVWAAFRVGEAVHRMRWISPGRFVMGSPEGEAGRWEDEGPQHEVVLTRGYWLGETAVTQGLWAAVMGTNPSRFKSETRPVETVSWDDCQGFIARLNERVEGLSVRLPTEAEWEHACRAGTTTATWLGAAGREQLDRIAWYRNNSGGETHRVGSKEANPWGLHDMLGNVWEWCADWSGAYSATPAVNPTRPERGTDRVLRGGSWSGDARDVRAAARGALHPVYRFEYFGFRLARGQSALKPVVP